MRNSQIQILSGVDTATQTGGSYFSGQWVSASFCPAFADLTAAGTLKIQCSNDLANGDPYKFVPANWCDIPNASSVIASGAGPAILIPNMAFGYIRAIYTRTGGGSSTIAVNMNVLSI
jgi:hypothetical protein